MGTGRGYWNWYASRRRSSAYKRFDRLSGHTMPPTTRDRSSSPVPRRSTSNIGPSALVATRRPSFSPRSSSLSRASSTVGSMRQSKGSGLRLAASRSPPLSDTNPLLVLDGIIRGSVQRRQQSDGDARAALAVPTENRGLALAAEINFQGRSLEDYAISTIIDGTTDSEIEAMSESLSCERCTVLPLLCFSK